MEPPLVVLEATAAHRASTSGTARVAADTSKVSASSSCAASLLSLEERQAVAKAERARAAQIVEADAVERASEKLAVEVLAAQEAAKRRDEAAVAAASRHLVERHRAERREQAALGKVVTRQADLEARRLATGAGKRRAAPQCCCARLAAVFGGRSRRGGPEDGEDRPLTEFWGAEEEEADGADRRSAADVELSAAQRAFRQDQQERERAAQAAGDASRAEDKDAKPPRPVEPWMLAVEQLPTIQEALKALEAEELLALRRAFEALGSDTETLPDAELLQVFDTLGLGGPAVRNHAQYLRWRLPSRQHEVLRAQVGASGLDEVANPQQEHFLNFGEAVILLAKMRHCVYDEANVVGPTTTSCSG